jgi:DNA polymerase sigma
VNVESFGSFRTRTYLPNADIDIVVIGEINDRKGYDKLHSLLEEEDSFSQVSYIRSAKVLYRLI